MQNTKHKKGWRNISEIQIMERILLVTISKTNNQNGGRQQKQMIK